MLTAQLTERSLLAGADLLPVLERLAAGLGLQVTWRKRGRGVLAGSDGKDIEPWREGYPYPQLMRHRPYEITKQSLQIELLKLQQAVKAAGQRLLIVFEGRDAAGKGGAIRRFTENLNPRGTRVIALEKPAAHEQGNNYLRRFLPHLPAPGDGAAGPLLVQPGRGRARSGFLPAGRIRPVFAGCARLRADARR